MSRALLLAALLVAWASGALFARETELWVAVGDSGRRISSPDGELWQNDQHWEKSAGPLSGIAFGLGRFIAVGGAERAGRILATRDGRTWAELPARGEAVTSIAFGQERFLATQGAQILVSTDGATFTAAARLDRDAPSTTARPADQARENPRAIRASRLACGDTEAGFRFVILGQRDAPGGGDPISWRAVTGDGSRIEDYAERPALTDLVYGAGHFVAVGPERLESSHDGQTWEVVSCPGDHPTTVVWTGSRFIASATGALWISRDGLSWQRQPTPTAHPILWAREFPAPLYLGPILDLPPPLHPTPSPPPLLRAIALRPSSP